MAEGPKRRYGHRAAGTPQGRQELRPDRQAGERPRTRHHLHPGRRKAHRAVNRESLDIQSRNREEGRQTDRYRPERHDGKRLQGRTRRRI